MHGLERNMHYLQDLRAISCVILIVPRDDQEKSNVVLALFLLEEEQRGARL